MKNLLSSSPSQRNDQQSEPRPLCAPQSTGLRGGGRCRRVPLQPSKGMLASRFCGGARDTRRHPDCANSELGFLSDKNIARPLSGPSLPLASALPQGNGRRTTPVIPNLPGTHGSAALEDSL